MKKVGDCWKVYLALFLLIVLVAVFPYKEGFGVDDVMSLSWFTTKKQDVNDIYLDETKDKNEIKGEIMNKNTDNHVFNDKYGSGLSYTDIPYDVSYNNYKFN